MAILIGRKAEAPLSDRTPACQTERAKVARGLGDALDVSVYTPNASLEAIKRAVRKSLPDEWGLQALAQTNRAVYDVVREQLEASQQRAGTAAEVLALAVPDGVHLSPSNARVLTELISSREAGAWSPNDPGVPLLSDRGAIQALLSAQRSPRLVQWVMQHGTKPVIGDAEVRQLVPLLMHDRVSRPSVRRFIRDGLVMSEEGKRLTPTAHMFALVLARGQFEVTPRHSYRAWTSQIHAAEREAVEINRAMRGTASPLPVRFHRPSYVDGVRLMLDQARRLLFRLNANEPPNPTFRGLAQELAKERDEVRLAFERADSTDTPKPLFNELTALRDALMRPVDTLYFVEPGKTFSEGFHPTGDAHTRAKSMLESAERDALALLADLGEP